MFGLYSRRVTARAAIAATLVSVAVTFALELLTKGQGYVGLPSLIWGTLAGMVATVLLIASPKLSSAILYITIDAFVCALYPQHR